MRSSTSVLLICALFASILVVSNGLEDYKYEDEPDCRDDCSALNGTSELEVESCYVNYMEYYNYKFVKSMVNFGKMSVYAGIWAIRYEKADTELYDRVFTRLLAQYNNPAILGNVKFDEFNQTATFIYRALRPYSVKRDKSSAVKYEYYPSLKCSVPCIYELHTWQTLFYLSVVIFALALITVILYSISLRSQYQSFKHRLGNLIPNTQTSQDT